LDDLHISPVVVTINPKQIDVHHHLRVKLYYPKGVIRRYKRPVVLTAPPLAPRRVQEEAQLARASNRVFSIFPAAPGKQACVIPDGSPTRKAISGRCTTTVHPNDRTHEPEAIVTFTETWPSSRPCPVMTACLGRHTWKVIEGTTAFAKPGAKLRLLATRSSGMRAPQDYK
jgi:hypothetical protein